MISLERIFGFVKVAYLDCMIWLWSIQFFHPNQKTAKVTTAIDFLCKLSLFITDEKLKG